MTLYSFFKATASASRRSPSLLLLHRSRRVTSAASGDRSPVPVLTDHEQLSPAANSFGCLSSPGQIASPSVLHLLQSRRFTHTSAAGSPALLQPQFRRFASKPDAETIRDVPSYSEWSSKIYTMMILADLRSVFRGDANRGAPSKLEELRKNLDEIHRTMKESHSERIKQRDSVGAIWEQLIQMNLHERILFKAKDCEDYWDDLFLGRSSGTRFLVRLVYISGSCTVILLFLVVIAMFVVRIKGL